eukprot:scaffold7628_cov71-Phaeocystis_antarctica.AAC.1
MPTAAQWRRNTNSYLWEYNDRGRHGNHNEHEWCVRIRSRGPGAIPVSDCVRRRKVDDRRRNASIPPSTAWEGSARETISSGIWRFRRSVDVVRAPDMDSRS